MTIAQLPPTGLFHSDVEDKQREIITVINKAGKFDVLNATETPIPAGTVVEIVSAVNGVTRVAPAQPKLYNDIEGVTDEVIPALSSGQTGSVTDSGLTNMNLTGFTVGEPVWLGANGLPLIQKPSNEAVQVGVVITAGASGVIYVQHETTPPSRITSLPTKVNIGDYNASFEGELIDVYSPGTVRKINLPTKSIVKDGHFSCTVGNQNDDETTVEVFDPDQTKTFVLAPGETVTYYYHSAFGINDYDSFAWTTKATQVLSVSKYRNMIDAAYGQLPNGKYKLFFPANQGPQNGPFPPNASAQYTYEFEITKVAESSPGANDGIYKEIGSWTSDFDFTYNKRITIRTAKDFTTAVPVNYSIMAFSTDIAAVQQQVDDLDKAFFLASSIVDVPVNTDPANPSFLGPLTIDQTSGFTVVDAASGAVRNDTGRALGLVEGNINLTPNKFGGGTTAVDLVSERALDMAGPWTGNLMSLRPFEIANNGESFQTKLSVADNWLPGEIIRFRMYAVSGGAIQFESVARTILGEVYQSPSVAWYLKEV